MRDHVALRDQSQARIAHTRHLVIDSWISMTFALDRANRREQRVQRSIERVARSRIRLAEARRTLARR